jgi:ABC-type sugar transport system substrate-binding protein
MFSSIRVVLGVAAALWAGAAAYSGAWADAPIRVTVIGAGKAGNPFFSPIVTGTKDAGAAFGVDVDFQYADLDRCRRGSGWDLKVA